MQRLFAIAFLTVKAAVRFRLFLVQAVLLLAVVIGLPLVIKDDGTAEGFTQILLTYTLGLTSAILGLSTLWLGCGTLARDVEECQIQMVAVKPIARWQIWLGKWLGIMLLNLALLTLAGTSIYLLLQWRASRLPPDLQAKLHNEILVARASLKPLLPNLDAAAERFYQQRLKQDPAVAKLDPDFVRKQLRQQLRNQLELVPPGMYKTWRIDFGLQRDSVRNQPLFLRVKFNTAQLGLSGTTFAAMWQVGRPETVHSWQTQQPMSLAPDTFHEIQLPPNLLDDQGRLTINFFNVNDTALLFPLDDGIEVLYRQGGFGPNYVRGLAIILLWLGLLAAIGLAAASALSFPVASFLAVAVLVLGLSTGTINQILYEGSIWSVNHNTGVADHPAPIDYLMLPLFRALHQVIGLVEDFSPIDLLSTGRSISWTDLGMACAQIGLLLGGVISLVGMSLFSRRELATAQGQQ
ncbi:MAG: hypothetical protein KGS61_06645 [Verrucomicrobia bacterium]|nr:hypothetical protein [Verrucomicrobiota bacterium]